MNRLAKWTPSEVIIVIECVKTVRQNQIQTMKKNSIIIWIIAPREMIILRLFGYHKRKNKKELLLCIVKLIKMELFNQAK